MAVSQTKHGQHIREARHTKTDPALVLRFMFLFGKWETSYVDHVVHHPHSNADGFTQQSPHDRRLNRERLRDKASQVDRTQKAGPVWRQRLFCAGVGAGDFFDIFQVVGAVDAVDEDHTRLGIVVGRAHDLFPECAGRDHVVDVAAHTICTHHGADVAAFAGEDFVHQRPQRVVLDGCHEIVGDQHGQVEHPQFGWIALGVDE